MISASGNADPDFNFLCRVAAPANAPSSTSLAGLDCLRRKNRNARSRVTRAVPMMLPTIAPARAPSLIPLEDWPDRGGVCFGTPLDEDEGVVESVGFPRCVASCWGFVSSGRVWETGVDVLSTHVTYSSTVLVDTIVQVDQAVSVFGGESERTVVVTG